MTSSAVVVHCVCTHLLLFVSSYNIIVHGGLCYLYILYIYIKQDENSMFW